MEGLEVQIVELQGDQRKLREQSKLERERWKEEKAVITTGTKCSWLQCTSEVQSVCVCMCVINNQKGLTNA